MILQYLMQQSPSEQASLAHVKPARAPVERRGLPSTRPPSSPPSRPRRPRSQSTALASGIVLSLNLRWLCHRNGSLGPAPAVLADPAKEPPRLEFLVPHSDVVQRHGQLAHHCHEQPPCVTCVAGLLGFIPGTHAALLDQPHGREVQPLPRPRMAPLADPQLPLVCPAAPLHQVQAHRLAIGGRRVKLPRVTCAHPQHTGRRYTHHLSLRLEDLMSDCQLTQSPLRLVRLPPSGECLLGVLLDLTLLPGSQPHAHARACAGQ